MAVLSSEVEDRRPWSNITTQGRQRHAWALVHMQMHFKSEAELEEIIKGSLRITSTKKKKSESEIKIPIKRLNGF